MDAIDRAREIIAQGSRITVLTGAGISTDAGIPDFRGPQGVWTKNPKAERMSTLSAYIGDREVRELAWQSRMRSPVWEAQPTRGHHALVELERAGVLHAIVTQNIDRLHHKAGNDPSRIYEVHGNALSTVCWSCGDVREMTEAIER
ncbi:MAG: SIR2 family NAD-dependent protein deacylase, partial [Ilumatobacteraceae bacterium]